jgi:hypothetical protein
MVYIYKKNHPDIPKDVVGPFDLGFFILKLIANLDKHNIS